MEHRLQIQVGLLKSCLFFSCFGIGQLSNTKFLKTNLNLFKDELQLDFLTLSNLKFHVFMFYVAPSMIVMKRLSLRTAFQGLKSYPTCQATNKSLERNILLKGKKLSITCK